jgi:hypothetical protein
MFGQNAGFLRPIGFTVMVGSVCSFLGLSDAQDDLGRRATTMRTLRLAQPLVSGRVKISGKSSTQFVSMLSLRMTRLLSPVNSPIADEFTVILSARF